MRSGLVLMAWGFFKKVVIADRLALFVNPVYSDPESYKGIPLIVATVFFAFQIFCDFSGYSDIAIGSARCMGYNLMTNFDRPYMATSISEFWRRWHISLSTWFRDYLYIPLGGNRVSKPRWYFNLFFVFLLSGVWHGANWTFVIWGGLHGIYLVIENEINKRFPFWEKSQQSFMIFIKRATVFFFVVLAWVFFRAQNVHDAFYILKNLFVGIPGQLKALVSNQLLSRLKLLYINQPAFEFFAALFFLAILSIIHHAQQKNSLDKWVLAKPFYQRWSIYYTIVLLFVLFGIFNRSEFIYFQF
jgi:D-alanyl-lipoteichoic acid acyltransferase DltB (MBOAT superfamily)